MLASLTAGACGAVLPAASLRIGAMFPLEGSARTLAADEFRGAAVAAGLINAAGGVAGKQVVFDVRDVESASQTQSAAASLEHDGVPVVVGTYSSALSIPAATAVAAHGMVYWETGAVADQLTGMGLPLVFRVGADGADLGANSAQFVAEQVASRLQMEANALRVFLVTANDAYAHSVADAARAGLGAQGSQIVGESVYDPYAPQWSPVLAAIESAQPDVIVLSSHIPDGIAFRRAFVAAHLHVKAFIGSTMAQCLPDFGDALGPDAVGVFASDRPPHGFNARALQGAARALYGQFAAKWQKETGRQPSEEGISGFTATWVLLHDVMQHAAPLTPHGIASSARALDLPTGALPNGGGVRFSTSPGRLGQNLRAAAVIWQWQGVRQHAVVWPAVYATASVKFVPLP